jgi:hypothetical protein
MMERLSYAVPLKGGTGQANVWVIPASVQAILEGQGDTCVILLAGQSLGIGMRAEEVVARLGLGAGQVGH